MKSPRFSWTDLAELRDQLCAWRKSQTGRKPIPEDVWMAAAALASKLGVSQVARTLRLDFYKLRRRCGSSPKVEVAESDSPAFVEVQLEGGFQNDGGLLHVELTSVRGDRMTIGLGRDVAALVALAEAFWRQAP